LGVTGTRLLAAAFLTLALGSALGIWLRARQRRVPGPMPVLLPIVLASLPIFAIGVGWKLAVAWTTVGNPFLHLADVRLAGLAGDMATPLAIRSLVIFGYLAALNLGVLWIQRPGRLVFALSIALGLLLFLNDLSIGARGSIVNGGLLMASAQLVAGAGRSHGLRRLAGTVGIVVVTLLTATTIVWLRSDRAPGSYASTLTIGTATYASATVPASSFFLDHPWPTQVPGHWSFGGFWQLIDVGSSALPRQFDLSYDTFYAPVTESNPFNTGTFLTYFYSDFRAPGALILSALSGLAAGYLFAWAVRDRHVVAIQLAALAMFTLIFTPRGFVWSGMVFWPLLLVIVAQPFILRRFQHHA